MIRPTAATNIDIRLSVVEVSLPPEKVKDVTDVVLTKVKSMGGKVISDKPSKLDGWQAEQIVDEIDKSDGRYRCMEIVAIKNGKGYILCYQAPPEAFDKYQPDVDDLVKSFRWASPAK